MVISIIIMLASFVVPAVSDAIVKGQRAQSMNNMKGLISGVSMKVRGTFRDELGDSTWVRTKFFNEREFATDPSYTAATGYGNLMLKPKGVAEMSVATSESLKEGAIVGGNVMLSFMDPFASKHPWDGSYLFAGKYFDSATPVEASGKSKSISSKGVRLFVEIYDMIEAGDGAIAMGYGDSSVKTYSRTKDDNESGEDGWRDQALIATNQYDEELVKFVDPANRPVSALNPTHFIIMSMMSIKGTGPLLPEDFTGGGS